MLVNQSSSVSSIMQQFYAWNDVTLSQRVQNVTLSDIALLLSALMRLSGWGLEL